jgi:c-opsin
MHVYIMSIISFERYYVLKHPSNMKKITNKKVTIAIMVSVIFSLFWTLMPLLGWSRYTLEDGLTGCSIEWKPTNLNIISYNISMFIFVFFLPFGLIFITNFKSFLFVSIKYLYFYLKKFIFNLYFCIYR